MLYKIDLVLGIFINKNFGSKFIYRGLMVLALELLSIKLLGFDSFLNIHCSFLAL